MDVPLVRSAISVATAQGQARALVWSVWCDHTADPLHKLILTLDPDLIVLDGGLIWADGEADDLMFVVSDAMATVGGQTHGVHCPWFALAVPAQPGRSRNACAASLVSKIWGEPLGSVSPSFSRMNAEPE